MKRTMRWLARCLLRRLGVNPWEDIRAARVGGQIHSREDDDLGANYCRGVADAYYALAVQLRWQPKKEVL